MLTSLKKHRPICAPKAEFQLPGAGSVADAANSAVPPVRVHEAAVVTTAPAVAVNTLPRSQQVSVAHLVAVNVKR